MWKIDKSSLGSDDLSFGFHRDKQTRGEELSNYKRTGGNYQVGNYSNDGFGFAERQEKATYGIQ